MRKQTSIIATKLTVLLLAICISIAPAHLVFAGVSGWNAGNIIDDGVFVDKTSMTAADIQNFLNSKVPVCDTNGTQTSEYGGGTRAQWGQAHYGQSTFTCLKDYIEGGRSAAQIIYDTAQKYDINPQVLIVLLQKEQSLVTDTWPLNIQYKTATGYGCPDTAPCDSQYYGLTNQLDWSGTMFRAIMNQSSTWYSPYTTGTNFVRWSPTSSCGGANVNIQNWATAALYDYTPYQPNQAALDAGWGNGDGCSAYGNRNFYLYFTSWFGSTHSPAYAWSPESLNIWDEAKTHVMPTDFLHKNERMFVELKAQNIGSSTWTNDGANPVMLGTIFPQDHASKFCDIQWPGCNRAAKLQEASVAPGAVGTFDFYIHAPADGGQFWEYFMPLAEGKAWMTNYRNFSVYDNSTDYYDWGWSTYDAWTDSSKTTHVNIDDLARNQNVYVELKVLNKSATIWHRSGGTPTNLGTAQPHDRSSIAYTNTWLSKNRVATQLEETVLPGQTATFAFNLKAPSTLTVDREYFSPVIEYRGWGSDSGYHIYLHTTH